MVRIPRRTHSVSGPPSVHCVWKDVACCCNMVKIQQFRMSLMALRRNPHRKCKQEDVPTQVAPKRANEWPDEFPERKRSKFEPARELSIANLGPQPSESFPFFALPREVRDHVYSYLVLRRGQRVPIIEAKSILREQRKRVTAQRTRDRLNVKRSQTGRRPIAPREIVAEPVVNLNIMQASKQLHYEASDCFYQRTWFAVSMDNFPTIETPFGWDYNRITKMQLELQLKDAQRMNSYIDWTPFFAMFPSLRVLRIIPSFHPRYYAWAHSELNDWNSAHYVFRAFFRELLACIPERFMLKLGPSLDPEEDMHLEGKMPVGRNVLWDMYAQLGMRRDLSGNGCVLSVGQIVDCTNKDLL